MDDRSGSGWAKKLTSFKHVHGVIRHFDSSNGAWAAEFDEDVVQTRGLQRDRKRKPAAEASDPPPADRPPLYYPQHYMTDPGPHSGYSTLSSQPSNQLSQSQYSGVPNQPSYYVAQQNLTGRPQNSFGHTPQSSASPPPSSANYGSYGRGYPPPPGSSGPNYYQGSQNSHNYTASPTSYGPVSNRLDSNSSNSTSQPYDHRQGGHGQNQNEANGMYGNPYPGPRPDRVASAPGFYGCPYHYPDNGS